MVATIIPFRRTIRGVDSFEYAIPSDLAGQISRGTCVWIPLRNKVIPGLVQSVANTEPTDVMRPITSVCEQQPWQDRVELLEWFSQYYGVSLATAFKVTQFPLLKRPKKTELMPIAADARKPTIPKAAAPLLQQVVSAIESKSTNGSASYVVQYSHRTDCVALYTILAQRSTGNVLLIVPEYNEVAALSAITHSGKRVIAVPEYASPSFMHALYTQLQEATDIIVISTKKGAFLPANLFSLVICDQEQSPSHKQIDSNPRYTVPDVLRHIGASGHTPIVYTSASPSLTSYAATHGGAQHSAIFHSLVRKRNSQELTVVNMEHEYENKNYSWFSGELQERIAAGGKHLLLLNRTGQFRIAQCADCNELLELQAARCENCGSINIKKHRKGTAELEENVRTLFPQKNVLRIDRTVAAQEYTPEQLKSADIIIGTEKALRVCNIDTLQSIALLSVDHLLVYPHYRSHERVHQLLATVASLPVPLLLQTHAPEHPVIRSIMHQQYSTYAEAELSTRSFLELPPYGERIQLVDSKTRKRSAAPKNLNLQTLPPHIHIDRT